MNDNRPVTEEELTTWILERLAQFSDAGLADFDKASGRWRITPYALKALVRRMAGWQDDPERCAHEWSPYGWKNEYSEAKGMACWRCGKHVEEIPITILKRTPGAFDRIG